MTNAAREEAPLIDNASEMIIDAFGIRGREGVKHEE